MIQNIAVTVENKSENSPLTSEQVDVVNNTILDHSNETSALLSIFHSIQNQLGYVPEGALPLIGKALNLSRADVFGVLSFYHHFRTKPTGKKIVYICRAEACQAMGSMQLEQSIKEYLQIDYHQTTTDNCYTLEPIYCLGNCACAPSIQVDGQIVGRVTPAKIKTLLGTTA